MRTPSALIGIVIVLASAACAGNQMAVDAPEPDGDVRPERITDFDARVLTLQLTREDGSLDHFDSVRDSQGSWAYPPVLPNHVGRVWILRKTKRDSSSLVYALIGWDDDDPTDYLAAGYWLRFPGPRVFGNGLVAAERQVFIDGPEIDPSDPPQLPVSGTATYVGPVGGLYEYSHGSDWTDVEAPVVADEFAATMNIEASFADGTLSGCIGCIGDIRIERRHLYAYLGFRRRPVPEAPPTDYELHFGLTAIDPDGTFRNTEVSVLHPDRIVTQSSGSWSGTLSNVPDDDGFPRLVAGKMDAEFQEADGSQGNFQGIFTALGESLLPPDPGGEP